MSNLFEKVYSDNRGGNMCKNPSLDLGRLTCISGMFPPSLSQCVHNSCQTAVVAWLPLETGRPLDLSAYNEICLHETLSFHVNYSTFLELISPDT